MGRNILKCQYHQVHSREVIVVRKRTLQEGHLADLWSVCAEKRIIRSGKLPKFAKRLALYFLHIFNLVVIAEIFGI